MHSRRRKTPRVLAFGIAFLVLTLCFATEAINTVFASSAASASPQAAASAYTPAPDNTAVTTYKQDNNHTGDQTNETILTTSNVNPSTFGKRVSYPVDGQIYAQPLYVPNVTIGGTPHNVVFVETEHDSVYAFDADQTSAVAPLWHTSYISPPSVISPSNTDLACNDLIPEDGLSGTPVIDTTTGTMYVVVMTESSGTFTYNLHAIDITTGQDKPGSPQKISASVSGSGIDASGGKVTFNAKTERQRAGLIFSQGKIYIAFGSFCDHNPYHGWILSYSYDGSAFTQNAAFATTPNGTRGGLWASGGAIVADSAGNIYMVSGNGDFNGASGSKTMPTDFGDSFVRLDANLQPQDYFSPFNQDCLDAEDADLGSGGPLLVPGQNRLLGAGKEGRIYVMDTANMGKYTNPYTDTKDLCQKEQPKTNIDKIVEELPQSTIGGLYGSAAYWQSAAGQQFIYYAGANDYMKQFAFSGGVLSPSFSSQGLELYGFTGGNPTVSSNNGASGTGIVWSLAPQGTGTSQTGVLRAYDATNLSNELYSSQSKASRDGLKSYVKFAAPTVANGEVFAATKSSLDIFGLITPSGTPVASPTATGTTNPGGYNNVGISFDDNTKVANYDGGGTSYSESALYNDGIQPGGLLTGNGFVFTWPNVPTGSPDNWVANGEVIPLTPVDNADHLAFLGSATNGSATGTATVTYTDGSMQNVTIGFNDWAAKSVTKLLPGNSVVAVMPYRNTAKGKQTLTMNLYIDTVAIQTGKTVKSVTLPAIVTGGRMHVFALSTSSLTSPIYNSVCIQDDGQANPGTTADNGNLSPANCDGGGYGYSAQALRAAGVQPGWSVTAANMSFPWPDVYANESDNYQANGQTIAVTPVDKADTLGLLGAATNGSATGTGTITYTDGTTQSFTLQFSDWAATTVSFNNVVAVKMPYRDNSSGARQTKTMSLYVATVPLNTSKTLASVTLPATTKGGQIHVFALSTGSATAPVYNNAGISDNSNVAAGNFDGGGRSYSAQALQSVGVNPGDNAFDPTRSVMFTWPAEPSGTADNYICTGQTIPVENPQANTSVLAFLGASANGASSGTITITYTDGTTQTASIGFDDWTLGGGKIQKLSFANESISYTLAYRNNPAKTNGQENVKTYLFYSFVNIDPTRTIASVTLPSSTTGGKMHIFAVSTAAAN